MSRLRVGPHLPAWFPVILGMILLVIAALPPCRIAVVVCLEDVREKSVANAKARRWVEDAKFGLFVHWGVYSLLGKGEWAMNNDKLPISEYQKLPPRFNPVKFDADEWVRLAKAAGMKYITITSKTMTASACTTAASPVMTSSMPRPTAKTQ